MLEEHGSAAFDTGMSEFMRAHTAIEELERKIKRITFDQPLELRTTTGAALPIRSLADFHDLLPIKTVLVIGCCCYEHTRKGMWRDLKDPSEPLVRSYCLLADLCRRICNLDWRTSEFLVIVNTDNTAGTVNHEE